MARIKELQKEIELLKIAADEAVKYGKGVQKGQDRYAAQQKIMEKILVLEEKLTEEKEKQTKENEKQTDFEKLLLKQAAAKEKKAKKLQFSQKDFVKEQGKILRQEADFLKGMATKNDLSEKGQARAEEHADLIVNLGTELMDQAALEDKISEIKMQRATDSLDLGEKHYDMLLSALETRVALSKAEEVSNAAMETTDSLLDNMASGAKDFVDTLIKNPWVALITAAGAALVSFSATLDSIGEKFGVLGVTKFREDIALAGAEAQKLGVELDDVMSGAAALSSEFGMSFQEAIGLTGKVADLGKVLGLGQEEAAQLLGTMTTMGGMSTETALQLAKQAESLAVAEGVAPGVVMSQIADSSESFAKYTKDSGKNMLTVAVQAAKLGATLDDVAAIGDNLLDIETSLAAEMEASAMIGKQLNFQRARELALAGDMDGMMKSVIDQLGSQAELESMNVLQRESLAAAIGVSTDQLAEFIANQDKANELGEKITDQPFEDMIGKDAMSSLTNFLNEMKSLGAVLVETIGPALDMVAGVFSTLASGISESTVALNILKGAAIVGMAALAGKALASMWAGLGSLWAIPFIGPGLAIAAGVAGTAAIMNSISSAKSIGDGAFPAKGKPMVSTSEGSFVGTQNDDVLVGPGIAGGGSSVSKSEFKALKEESKKQNKALNASLAEQKKVNQNLTTAIETLASMPLQIGKQNARRLTTTI